MSKKACGVDEAGRGPLVGSVFAAAVILDPNNPIEGLKDSKKLTPAKRKKLEAEIKEKALSWSVASASREEIDDINILQASLLAMRRAVEGLSVKPDAALVDGNQDPRLGIETETIVKGDSKEPAISAASILAKEARDREMDDLAKIRPEYGFEKHKGYPTAEHLKALREHGVCPEHRASFGPVREMLGQSAGPAPKPRKPA